MASLDHHALSLWAVGDATPISNVWFSSKSRWFRVNLPSFQCHETSLMLRNQIDGAIMQDTSLRTNGDQDLRRYMVSPSAYGFFYPILLKPKSKLFSLLRTKCMTNSYFVPESKKLLWDAINNKLHIRACSKCYQIVHEFILLCIVMLALLVLGQSYD